MIRRITQRTLYTAAYALGFAATGAGLLGSWLYDQAQRLEAP